MKRILIFLAAPIILVACQSGNGDHNKGKGSVTEQAAEVEIGNKIGQQAPELAFPNPEGEVMTLSSLRGKMVLIDFWAAWCGPCREENPNLVRLYREYKDKEFINGSGFTVYGVSLDRRKEDWVTAIRNDKLEWETNVSDLRGWQSVAAAMYQVMGIPSNFLIDGDGIIVAIGLRGVYLENKLKELLK